MLHSKLDHIYYMWMGSTSTFQHCVLVYLNPTDTEGHFLVYIRIDVEYYLVYPSPVDLKGQL